MIDLGEVHWYDDCYDPYDDRPPKEEPDCGGCCDAGTVPAPWWLRLFGRPRIGCPSCSPGRLQVALWNLRYRLPRMPWRRRPLNDTYDDEAPF